MRARAVSFALGLGLGCGLGLWKVRGETLAAQELLLDQVRTPRGPCPPPRHRLTPRASPPTSPTRTLAGLSALGRPSSQPDCLGRKEGPAVAQPGVL